MSWQEQPKTSTPPKDSRHHALCPECSQIVVVYWGGYPPDWRYLHHLLGPTDGYCIKSKEPVDANADGH